MPVRNNNSRFGYRSEVPGHPVISNLNSLLSDIHVRYIQLKFEDFQLHYDVFMDIFLRLHELMKQVDCYYERYSSTIQFAGSHYDRLRIKKPDEFDMDIVIGLPLNIYSNSEDPNQSDYNLEPQGAGFMQLKMGPQFINLPYRDGAEWKVNRVAFEWGDDQNYLLSSKFINWFKGVVTKALHASKDQTYYVDGVPYTVRTSESGPAITLIIENKKRRFKLDVDLVPALRFPENRWPICRGYRRIPNNVKRDYWMAVPKPNKTLSSFDQHRSWRFALQDQEREIMKNLYNCKFCIRLVKKLKDAQNMKKIASYYIKTLFLWEIEERNNPYFWRKSPAELFKIMVTKFYKAMCEGHIPYYWHPYNNLIKHVNKATLDIYAATLAQLLKELEDPSRYKMVAKYLLTTPEFSEYNNRILNI